jgi:predicted secreted Zn-dependent protease
LAAAVGGVAAAQGRQPGVRVARSNEYFDVTVATMPQLDAVVRERHARGVDWFGLTRTRLSWSVPVDSQGGCRLSSASVDLSLTVVLPRLAPGVRLSERDGIRWRELARHVEQHEAEHVRISTEGAHRVLAAIRNADCRTWGARAQQEVRRIDLLQAEFDRSDTAGAQASFTRAIAPNARPDEAPTADEELNGRPVEWTVGN